MRTGHSGNFLVAIIGTAGLAVMGRLFYVVQPHAYDLRLNPYGLLSFIALIANLGVLIKLSTLKAKDASTQAFTLLMGALIVWSATELLQRLSVTLDGYIFWDGVQALGWVIAPLAYLIFTLSYLKIDLPSRYPWAPGFLAVLTGFFLYIGTATGLIDSHSPADYFLRFWGYDTSVHPYMFPFLIWLEGMFLVSLFLLWQAYRRSSVPAKKRQIFLITVATSIPILGGSFNDGILPAFGVQVMPVAVLLTAVMASIITYSMFRYNLLSFNPATVASNILETMQEAVIVLNPDYSIEYSNRKVERLLGMLTTDLIGLPLHAICSYYSFLSIRNNLLEPLKDQPFTTLNQITIGTRAKFRVPVSLSAAKLTDDQGAITGYVIALTDITALGSSLESLKMNVSLIRKQNLKLEKLGHRLRKEKEGIEHTVERRTQQVKEEHAKLLASIDGLNLGYVMVDPHLRVLVANTAAAKALGEVTTWAPEGMAAISNALAPETRLEEQVRDCIRDQRAREIRRVAAGERFLDIFLSPISSEGKAIGAVIVLQDVTEALVLERTKNEFFTIASHELRTPLTAIRGYTEMIKVKYGDQSKDPNFQRMLERIDEGSNRLLRIVNDFLSLSRLEQGRIDFRPERFDACQLIEEVIRELEPVASAKKLSVSLDHSHPACDVWADKEKVKQILVNLIGNAVKFTDRGGIHLETRQRGNTVTVRVQDTGLGISKANQHLLFGKFQQAGSSLLTRDASHGTGVGLYISKLIVEGMGGEIRLESSLPGRGSVFCFTLPINPSA